MSMQFEGKSVLITGGASGIGLLSGKCFAKEGAKVALSDLNKDGLDAAVSEIKEFTDNVIGIVTDVTNYSDVKHACDETVEKFGSIDILIACAGGAETRLKGIYDIFYNLPIEVIDFGIDLNLKGAIYFDHAVMKQMEKQHSGVIINLGSITGYEGAATNIAYAASKSALMNGVVKSLALAGEKIGVRALCIAPGPVLTRPGMAHMKTLLGRAAQTQEIADLIMYACSDKGAFMDGTTIMIDGGRAVMENRQY